MCLTYPHPPLCAKAFIMCSKSNPLVVFALDLVSTYEGEHTIFGLLGQARWFQLFKNNVFSWTYILIIYCCHKSTQLKKKRDIV
jgi:hypothetical protein